jgi:hypothetical protein
MLLRTLNVCKSNYDITKRGLRRDKEPVFFVFLTWYRGLEKSTNSEDHGYNKEWKKHKTIGRINKGKTHSCCCSLSGPIYSHHLVVTISSILPILLLVNAWPIPGLWPGLVGWTSSITPGKPPPSVWEWPRPGSYRP